MTHKQLLLEIFAALNANPDPIHWRVREAVEKARKQLDYEEEVDESNRRYHERQEEILRKYH